MTCSVIIGCEQSSRSETSGSVWFLNQAPHLYDFCRTYTSQHLLPHSVTVSSADRASDADTDRQIHPDTTKRYTTKHCNSQQKQKKEREKKKTTTGCFKLNHIGNAGGSLTSCLPNEKPTYHCLGAALRKQVQYVAFGSV